MASERSPSGVALDCQSQSLRGGFGRVYATKSTRGAAYLIINNPWHLVVSGVLAISVPRPWRCQARETASAVARYRGRVPAAGREPGAAAPSADRSSSSRMMLRRQPWPLERLVPAGDPVTLVLCPYRVATRLAGTRIPRSEEAEDPEPECPGSLGCRETSPWWARGDLNPHVLADTDT